VADSCESASRFSQTLKHLDAPGEELSCTQRPARVPDSCEGGWLHARRGWGADPIENQFKTIFQESYRSSVGGRKFFTPLRVLGGSQTLVLGGNYRGDALRPTPAAAFPISSPTLKIGELSHYLSREDILCSQSFRCFRALTLKIHIKKFIKKLIKNMSG
jgi:hypothetical protein